jgi:hypothetical protein
MHRLAFQLWICFYPENIEKLIAFENKEQSIFYFLSFSLYLRILFVIVLSPYRCLNFILCRAMMESVTVAFQKSPSLNEVLSRPEHYLDIPLKTNCDFPTWQENNI